MARGRRSPADPSRPVKTLHELIGRLTLFGWKFYAQRNEDHRWTTPAVGIGFSNPQVHDYFTSVFINIGPYELGVYRIA
jgi:hypothetical protein